MLFFDMTVKMKEYKDAESLNALVQEKLQNNANTYGKSIAKVMRNKCNLSLDEYNPSGLVQFAYVSKKAMDFIGKQIAEGAKGNLVVLCEIDGEKLRENLNTLPKKEPRGFNLIFGKRKELEVEKEVEVER